MPPSKVFQSDVDGLGYCLGTCARNYLRTHSRRSRPMYTTFHMVLLERGPNVGRCSRWRAGQQWGVDKQKLPDIASDELS